jgi:signal peptidase I
MSDKNLISNYNEVEEEKSEKTQVKNWLREAIEIVIFAVVLALFIRTYVVQAFKIPTGSMESTLLIGDHILVNKFIYSPVPSFLRFILPVREPERGDITVFKYPQDMTRDFVKRLIGKPNETIQSISQRIYVDDKQVKFEGKEQFIDAGRSPNLDYLRDNFGPTKIPENHYFMMGDNRNNSSDSRVWGFLDRSLVKGRVLFVYFSGSQKWELEAYQGEKTFFKSLLNRVRWNRFLKIIT